MTNDADQILPRLWLGNFTSSQNVNFLKQNNITVIVNCTKDLPFQDIPGVYKYRVPVHDNLEKQEIYAMSKWIEKILPVLADHYRQGRAILIHCAMGMQRSAIVTLCFLHQYFGYEPKNALIKMRTRRPIVFSPYMNFRVSFFLLFGDNAYHKLVT
jgi:protein-tyrosine phosphatase